MISPHQKSRNNARSPLYFRRGPSAFQAVDDNFSVAVTHPPFPALPTAFRRYNFKRHSDYWVARRRIFGDNFDERGRWRENQRRFPSH
jgi:hypothetical protein